MDSKVDIVPTIYYITFCLLTIGCFVISGNYYRVASYKMSGMSGLLFGLFALGLTGINNNQEIYLFNELIIFFSTLMGIETLLTIYHTYNLLHT